ncbi:hypothetical protein GPECTOR_9g431 [Gonium pectorale]|uniref:BFN domain-containing protein n=1 Tax=Gonium pectorale TaxID=33097 RepID=A0A150GRF4_GONPE|nr:hypothetical protein GPECTOR_9g431 [Gonium pectorale]|eukprot:KXZ52387.1 hypothetical protein GPECTOR_9g431 [Gonium pectorale]
MVPTHDQGSQAYVGYLTRQLAHVARADVPCVLTVRNRSPRLVEALWVNYDDRVWPDRAGDEEPYTTIPPGYAWTVDTYELLQLVDVAGMELELDAGAAGDEASGGAGPGGRPGATAGGRRRRGALRPDGEQSPTQTSGVSAKQAQQQQQAGGAGGGGRTQPAVDAEEAGAGRPDVSRAQAAQPDAGTGTGAGPPERTGRAGGFDGLGHPASQYVRARLQSVAVLPASEQAVVVLGLEGYTHPLSLLVGVPEARNIVNAAGEGAGAARGRRPALMATWADTLQEDNDGVGQKRAGNEWAVGATLERVVITRQVGGVFYSRIVLSQPAAAAAAASIARASPATEPPHTGGGAAPLRLPWQTPAPPGAPSASAPDSGSGGGPSSSSSSSSSSTLVSVDSRPSNALALALEAGVDVYVAVPLAELVQQQYADVERDLPDLLLPPPDERSLAGGMWQAPSA